MNKILIQFNRSNLVENNTDIGEKIGNAGLGLLRIGFGHTVTVEQGSTDQEVSFTQAKYSAVVRIAASVLCVLIFPITLISASVGYVGMAFSKSYQKIFHVYNQQDKAAIKIQKCFCQYLERQSCLPGGLSSRHRVQCERIERFGSSSIPRAEGGSTAVYLPESMPDVVLKRSGKEHAIRRLHQMQEVRSVLRSQQSRYLIIPRASVYRGFLVEQRLPINVNEYHNMGLYLSNPHLFDEPIREMVRLFSRRYLGDLVGDQLHPLGHIDGVEDYVRYDNLPLYIVEIGGRKEGRIGLIDLEHIHNSPSSKGLVTLGRIFPLHSDLIRDEAKKLNMKVDENSFHAAVEKGRKFLKIGFTDHLEWLQRKGISINNPTQSFQVNPLRVEELTTLLQQKLLELHQGESRQSLLKKEDSIKNSKNLFTKNLDEAAREVAGRVVSFTVSYIQSQIEKQQKKQLSQLLDQEEWTEAQLIDRRSSISSRRKLDQAILQLISQRRAEFVKNRWWGDKMSVAREMTDTLMDDLVKGGEIFCYDPIHYSRASGLCWVRY